MKVLFAYDGFPHSRHALKKVAELAANGDAEVTIISVVPEAEARGSKAGRRRWLLPHAHQDVAIAHSYLHEQGVEAEMKIAYGDPADEIRKEAARGGYGIIVLGSRGHDRLGRLLLGSVSKKLVEEAPCPVLIAGKDVTVRHERQLRSGRRCRPSTRRNGVRTPTESGSASRNSASTTSQSRFPLAERIAPN